MPPVGFEPTFLAGERPQIYALDRTANGTGLGALYWHLIPYTPPTSVHRMVLDAFKVNINSDPLRPGQYLGHNVIES